MKLSKCQQFIELQNQVDNLTEIISTLQGLPDGWRCEEVCTVVGYANVAFDGEVFASCGNPVIEKIGTGLYEVVSAPAGAETHSVDAIVDADIRDGIHVHFDSSFTTGRISTSTGDNGATADVLVDTPISIKWYGKRLAVVCDQADPVEEEPGDDTGQAQPFRPLYPEANGKVVSDNFQDGNGNAPFNLQVRNTTNSAVNWQACTPPVPYDSIPNLNAQGANYQVVDNGDGTFLHCFDGASLGAFQNITITGGLPDPAGAGGSQNLSLHCE